MAISSLFSSFLKIEGTVTSKVLSKEKKGENQSFRNRISRRKNQPRPGIEPACDLSNCNQSATFKPEGSKCNPSSIHQNKTRVGK